VAAVEYDESHAAYAAWCVSPASTKLDLSRFDAAPLIAFTSTKEMNYETDPNGQIP
jgi:hypothetical protein